MFDGGVGIWGVVDQPHEVGEDAFAFWVGGGFFEHHLWGDGDGAGFDVFDDGSHGGSADGLFEFVAVREHDFSCLPLECDVCQHYEDL